MDNQHVEYKGFTIVSMPSGGTDGTWFGGYEILKDGVSISVRKNIFPGFHYFPAARDDSIEHAKLEIDNRVGANP